MKTGLTCRSFCNRLHRCYYYKSSNTYAHQSRLLFEKILKKYSLDPSQSLLEVFSNNFTNRSFTGNNSIYSNDKIEFKEYCFSCAINLDKFFSKYQVKEIINPYNYKFQIYGTIGGVIDKINVNINFSFKNVLETKKELDFHQINNYLYNCCTNENNDCLVMCVPQDSFILLEYVPEDYTIARGFLSSMVRNKLRRKGDHCKTCRNDCKGLFFNGLERFSIMRG